MEIKRVVRLYFSPTHGTQKVVDAVAEAMGAPESLVLDRTSFDSRWTGAQLREGDVAVIGVPVYYGRVPRIMVEFFRGIEGREIPAVLVASYGNRSVEDALLELAQESRDHGFLPVSAGAFIARHSFTERLGGGRPDAEDLRQAAELGAASAEQIRRAASLEEIRALHLDLPGSFPYHPAADLPMAPATDKSKCNGCMLCQQQCPVQAISPLDPTEVDGWRCLDCALCIQSCPPAPKPLLSLPCGRRSPSWRPCSLRPVRWNSSTENKNTSEKGCLFGSLFLRERIVHAGGENRSGISGGEMLY